MLPLDLIIVIIASIGNILLALFILLKNPKSATNSLFFLFTLTVAGYILLNYYTIPPHINEYLPFFVKTVIAFALLINFFFFLFVNAFPNIRLQINRWIFWIGLFATAILIPLTQTDFIFRSIVSHGATVIATPGLGMPLFLLDNLVFLGGGFFVLIKKYRKSVGSVKNQIRLLFLGTIFMFSLILFTNVLLVLVFNITSLVALLPLYTLLFIGFTGYAIIRHRMLDIHLIVARSIAYLLLLIFITTTFTAWLFITSNLFFKTNMNNAQTITLIGLMLVIAFFIDPVKAFLETYTDKLFFKGKYNSDELVLQLTQIMASTLLLDSLTQRALEKLLYTMRVTQGAFVIFKSHLIKNNANFSVMQEGYTTVPKFNEDAIKKLYSLKRIVIVDEEEDGEPKQLMRMLDIAVAVPLFDDKRDLGLLLLGYKKSGEVYSEQDIKVLEIVGPEVSVAIQNAKSFEKISKFNLTLREEVEKATKELTDANERLKELDRLKDEFVSVASHELRTPLTAIKSYLWMAIQGRAGELNEKQKYYVDRAYKSSDRLIKMVNDMLNISRIESGRLTLDVSEADLDTIAGDVVSEVLPRAEELGVTVHVEDHTVLPKVLADVDKLKEVLFNLIGNSLKFTPKGGKITISFVKKNDMVETRITDTGNGIAAEDIPKLFQKFNLLPGSYTTNQSVMGTGLGLFICRSIIEMHGGKIAAASEGKGKGSTFTFTVKVYSKDDQRKFATKFGQRTSDQVGLVHTQI